MLLALVSRADTLTYSDGTTVRGSFRGFANRKFEFRAADGTTLTEFPLKLRSIVAEAPLSATVVLSRKQYDNVDFIQMDHNTIRFKKDGKTVSEQVILVKSLSVMGGEAPAPAPLELNSPEAGSADAVSPDASVETIPSEVKGKGEVPSSKPRQWERSGKWREMATDESSVISHGEEVDIASKLKKGMINVVHLHLPSAVASVREGNYLDALASKRANNMVVRKVMIPDFEAPICAALKIKSLPQFWIYDAQGKLVKKLTDRFTEGDIDAALKEARRGLMF